MLAMPSFNFISSVDALSSMVDMVDMNSIYYTCENWVTSVSSYGVAEELTGCAAERRVRLQILLISPQIKQGCV